MADLFFCAACLVDKPLSEQSSDPRYCLGCHEYMKKELANLQNSTDSLLNEDITLRKAGTKMKMGKDAQGILSQPRNAVQGFSKRKGRRSKLLPMELIKQLTIEGSSSRDIVKRLKERGIEISYRTVQRCFMFVAVKLRRVNEKNDRDYV